MIKIRDMKCHERPSGENRVVRLVVAVRNGH